MSSSKLDRWLIGQPSHCPNDRWYLIHTGDYPFVAEVITPDEWDASEVAYLGAEYGLAGFRFLARVPPDPQLESLCDEGYRAVVLYNDKCEANVDVHLQQMTSEVRRGFLALCARDAFDVVWGKGGRGGGGGGWKGGWGGAVR